MQLDSVEDLRFAVRGRNRNRVAELIWKGPHDQAARPFLADAHRLTNAKRPYWPQIEHDVWMAFHPEDR